VEVEQTNGAMRQGINPITLHRCFNPMPHIGTDAQRLSLWPQSKGPSIVRQLFTQK
jgi:hypothetical protein